MNLWLRETPELDAWGYVAGSLVGVLLWLAIFLYRRDLRRRMLWVSLLLLPMAPLGESFFLLDYWNPPLILPLWYGGYEYGGLADFLFAFAMSGIATSAYPLLARRLTLAGVRGRKRWLALAFATITIGSVYLLTMSGPINSIFSSMLGFLLSMLLVWAVRPDLVRASLVSGLICAVALVAIEALGSFVAPGFISRYWLLYHSSFSILIAGRVPLTEALWSFTFGAAVGPLYDACVGAVITAPTTTTSTTSPSPAPSRITGGLSRGELIPAQYASAAMRQVQTGEAGLAPTSGPPKDLPSTGSRPGITPGVLPARADAPSHAAPAD